MPRGHDSTNHNMMVYIGKNVFDSLLEAAFKEEGKMSLVNEPFMMKVEDLEDMAEGFATAFNEDDEIRIAAQIDNMSSLQFDSDFNTISFKAEIGVDFYNPIDDRFLAAQAKLAFKGTAEVTI